MNRKRRVERLLSDEQVLISAGACARMVLQQRMCNRGTWVQCIGNPPIGIAAFHRCYPGLSEIDNDTDDYSIDLEGAKGGFF
jgi:hypothetical protein